MPARVTVKTHSFVTEKQYFSIILNNEAILKVFLLHALGMIWQFTPTSTKLMFKSIILSFLYITNMSIIWILKLLDAECVSSILKLSMTA